MEFAKKKAKPRSIIFISVIATSGKLRLVKNDRLTLFTIL